MFNRIILPTIAVSALMSNACTRPVLDVQRSNGANSLSDVSIKFSDDLNPKLREHLTNYHLTIAPENANCKASGTNTTNVEESSDWPKDKDLVIQKDLARGCTYLVKLDFGNTDATTKQLVPLFSNYVTGNGTSVVADKDKVSVDILLQITEAGKKLGLDKFVDEIKSDTDTSLDFTIKFGATLKLDGNYVSACVSKTASMSPTWVTESIEISGAEVSFISKDFTDADCKNDMSSSGHMEKSTFVLSPANAAGIPIDIKSKVGPIAPFDLIAFDKASGALSFGTKDATLDGSDAAKRPTAINHSVVFKKQ